MSMMRKCQQPVPVLPALQPPAWVKPASPMKNQHSLAGNNPQDLPDLSFEAGRSLLWRDGGSKEVRRGRRWLHLPANQLVPRRLAESGVEGGDLLLRLRQSSSLSKSEA